MTTNDYQNAEYGSTPYVGSPGGVGNSWFTVELVSYPYYGNDNFRHPLRAFELNAAITFATVVEKVKSAFAVEHRLKAESIPPPRRRVEPLNEDQTLADDSPSRTPTGARLVEEHDSGAEEL